jgi:hypothetical protein
MALVGNESAVALQVFTEFDLARRVGKQLAEDTLAFKESRVAQVLRARRRR